MRSNTIATAFRGAAILCTLAMVKVCLQAIGEDSIVAAAGAQGNFELNAMRPIIINNVRHSARILGDACQKLREFSIEGTELDQQKVSDYVDRSLMLVTALSPHVGYDKASAIAHKADDEGTTLREAALSLGVSADEFDRMTAARNTVAQMTLTPGTVKQAPNLPDPSASWQISRSSCSISESRNSMWRRPPCSVSDSSIGTSGPCSHSRPVTPNESETGGRRLSRRIRTAWISSRRGSAP